MPIAEVDLPKCKNKTISNCETWLQNNPPLCGEFGFIQMSFTILYKKLEAHYYIHSGDSKSYIWRNVRLVECLLVPELQKDFLEPWEKLSGLNDQP